MKKKLFICITKSVWGGAQKYVYDLATNLPKEKYNISVLLGENGELKKRLDNSGIKTILLENSQRDINIKKEFKLFLEIFRVFRKEKPDIIHLNSSKMGGVGAFAGRIAGVKKIIFTGHGWAFNEERNTFQKILIWKLHVLTILLSTKSIAVSKTTKKQIGWPWNRKMVVIRNGLEEINLKSKEEARKEIEKKISKEKLTNSIWIGTISELHRTKGLKYAIEAISKIKNVIFIIIGEGKERKNLEEISSKLGAKDKIFFLGRIETASQYLKAFDIFTLSSVTEALPYCLLEAGKASLPTIASGVGGIPEIIENEKTGILVPPRSPEEIRVAIENLIKHPEKMAYLSHNLKEKIDREFQTSDMIRKTIKIYDSV